jgi:hypothetical protein
METHLRGLQFVILMVFLLALGACEDKSDTGSGEGNYQDMKIIVLENNTDKRVVGAHIVIDGRSNLSCYTSSPDGNCTFSLAVAQHSIVISKTPYTTLDTTFLVYRGLTTKAFSLSQY